MPASNVNWSPPLTRLNPWYPGQFGVPGTDSTTGLRLDTNGTVFYVDPNAVGVSDGRDGTDPTEPLATVAAALAKCSAYKNDVIVVAPNAYWTYGNMAESRITPIRETVTVSTPGVRLVGLMPSATLGVPWVPSANNDTLITVSALDVTVEGFNFWTDTYTGVTGISATWDGTTTFGENLNVRHCFFYDIAYGISLDYAWNNYIEHCSFQDITTAAIHSLDAADFCTIRNNQFEGCTAAIDLEDTDSCFIAHNYIRGAAAGVNNFIDLTGGGSNLVVDNWLACSIVQYDTTCSDATSGSWCNNHCTDGAPVAPPT